MPLLQNLSCLVLKGAATAVGEFLGVKAVGDGTQAVAGFLARHFGDHSQKLTRALQQANDRAWWAVEIALAGDSWWERCRLTLATGEEKGLRQQVQTFLAATPLGGLPSHGDEFRRECLRQLQAARKAGILTGGGLDPKRLAADAGAFARHGDPGAVLDSEWQAIGEMESELQSAGYAALAGLVALRPPQGPPLLVAAARYFFACQVEKDRELFQGIAFARLEGLTQGQQAGFDALSDALDQHAQRLEELLGDVQAVVVETHAAVLDVQGELQRQGRQMQELGQAVLQALQQRQLNGRALNPGDSLSVRGDEERRLVKGLVQRYRALPADERRRLPALLNAIGKLEAVAGDFEAAQRDFQETATLVSDNAARAEAHANAYQAALERRQWGEALRELAGAAALDPERFAPFPRAKFEPERILGAGGFGVAFLCRNRHSGSRVVLKTLRSDNLDRNLNEVFAEARVLEELDHPAIIRLRDCDYADAGRGRPYLVMDYFQGQTLAEYVEEHGPPSPEQLLPLAKQVAEGLRAAHGRDILHRDVKPANLLVRREAGQWQVKLIDFGLAVSGPALKSTARSQGDRTLAGSSIAGTLDYAAPEQMGKLPGVAVAPYSDVYGFGKTCCYALFNTPQPTFQHWQKLPPPLAEFLGQCLSEKPAERPADFGVVVQRLGRLDRAPAGKPKGIWGALLEAQPVVEEVLAVVEPPRREMPRPRREPPRPAERPRPPRREPAPEPEAAKPVWQWVLVVLVLVAAGAFVVIWRNGGILRVKSPAAVAPATPPAEPIKDEEFPPLLAELKTAEPKRGAEIARRLAVTPVKEASRTEVARALNPLLKTDEPTKIAACQALAVWGTKDNVPELVTRLTGGDNDHVRGPAMKALAQIKDPRGFDAIADRLNDQFDRMMVGVKQILISCGPAAEAAVLRQLSVMPVNSAARSEACNVLVEIGTAKSIPALEGLVKKSKDKDHRVHESAARALAAVKARVAATQG